MMRWLWGDKAAPEVDEATKRQRAERRLAQEASSRQRREANAALAEALSHVIGDAVDSVRDLGRRHGGD